LILVDSSVWIDYFRGRATLEVERLYEALGNEIVATGDLILMEVLQGFRSDRDFDEARRLLTSLDVVEIGGRDVAIEAARNFRTMRASGGKVRKTIDGLIATRCIVSRFDLLFSGRDFEPFVRHLGLCSAMA
jgi:predicted nucleic acid-binding protein